MIRVALLGCGAWGVNLLRVLGAMRGAEVVAIADPAPEQLARAHDMAPRARLVRSIDDALAVRPDAVVVATPPATHAALALQALDAACDVFVEKPLALSVVDAERCVARARARGRVAMVGHLLRYHPTVVRLVELASAGALGDLVCFAASRFSVGGDRSTPALWGLGPHDLSVLRALRGDTLDGVDASATRESDRTVLETSALIGPTARIELCRAHHRKVRLIRVVGSDAVASMDDVAAPDRITLSTRAGERVLLVEWTEPLAIEIAHFLACVATRRCPLTPFEEGASIVRVLARAEGGLSERDIARACPQRSGGCS